jgi:hypothetical protein
VANFWIWFVRNPAFLVAAVGLASGASGIVEWSLAMPVTASGAVVGDAGIHLARASRLRTARKAARIAAEARNLEAPRRFTDYQRVERDAA